MYHLLILALGIFALIIFVLSIIALGIFGKIKRHQMSAVMYPTQTAIGDDNP